MDTEAIRAALTGAYDASAPPEQRVRNTRDLLRKRGTEAFQIPPGQIPPGPGIALDEILRIAIGKSPTDARREFAVMLVYAIGIEGVLPMRGETERLIRSFLEQALLNPLRRAGYPFDGTAYDKRQALAGLHATIEEHLRPLEPTMPRWLHGSGSQGRD
ncbi:MAG TPA: hypothetical protein VHX39_17860 [Acetobacteraceae bacterium]|nr:hypothetical protein [Acetobacteraceae bacterium]